MSDVLIAPSSTTTSRVSWRRSTPRWLASFLGFPLGGLTAKLIVGQVDSLTPALIGGLITGSILGAAQALGMGRSGPSLPRWIVATGLGLMTGLGVGAAVVDYRTNIGSLVVQGVICGLAVGIAQALVLWRQLGRLAFAWPVVLAAFWAAGWAITTSAGIKVEDRFTVFGASGAITVTALTVVLPLVLNRRAASAS